MRGVLFIFMMIVAQNVMGQKRSDEDLNILEATAEQWASGASIKNKGSKGTVYSIRVTSQVGKAFQLLEIIIHGAQLPFEIIKNKRRNYHGPIASGDTVSVIARYDAKQAYPKVHKPMVEEAVAGYIIYEIGKTKFFKPITSFSETRKKVANQ